MGVSELRETIFSCSTVLLPDAHIFTAPVFQTLEITLTPFLENIELVKVEFQGIPRM